MFNLNNQWGPTRLSLLSFILSIVLMVVIKDGNVTDALKSSLVLGIGFITAMVFLAEVKRFRDHGNPAVEN